jgi:TonB family protein
MRIGNNDGARGVRTVALSLALHGVMLALALSIGALSGAKVVERADRVTFAGVEAAGGSHAVEIPLPTRQTAADTSKPDRYADAAPPTTLPMRQLRPEKESGGGAPPVPHAGEGRGNAENGNGNGNDNEDALPAFPIFSPRPPVTDRALLPAIEAKIVVDVKVNEDGAVVSEDLVKGMGNQLDQIVLATVKTWRFQPATVNGKPVAAEAEIVFPFNLNYPVDGG